MRTMNIGKLNKRITFSKLGDVADELGQTKQGLVDVKTVWASFYPIRGAEFYEIQKTQARVTHKCYVRYISDIDSNNYIKYDGEIYDITSIIDVDGEHKMLEIYCNEHLNKEVIADDGD